MEIVQNRALVLCTRNPDRVTEVIPQSHILEEVTTPNGAGYRVAVKWSLQNTKILQNLGFKRVPSPIEGQYNWPGMYKPFAHQIVTSGFLTLHQRAYCLNDMGTGKTSSGAWAADYLLSKGIIRRVLVICPLSIMDSAWRADLFKTVMHRRVDIAHGSKDKRIKVINSDAEFVIINYDGVESVQDELAAGGFDLIICDEASALKTATTRRWKVINSLIRPDTWLWLMTGTPAAQSPMDAYGLAKMLNPRSVPSFAGAFRDKVMFKLSTFRYIPKPEAQQIVHEVLQPAVRFTKEECLDLPDMTYNERTVPMTTQQEKYYKLLRKELLIQTAGEEVTALNAAIQMNKLLQIACIAYNTPVLTDSGWVPIQEVTPLHRVWDGTEWVKQDGAIFRGGKEVEECWGVQMTLDHRVLTTAGWQTAGDILYGKSSVEFNRETVRLPNGYRKSGDNPRGIDTMCDLAVPMCLWKSGGAKESVSTSTTSKTSEELRVPSWERNAQNVEDQSIQQLPQYVAALPKPFRQGLQELWGKRYYSLCTVARVVREFLGRHGRNAQAGINLRPHRQQWPLFPGELPLGYSERTGTQHTSECFDRYPRGEDDHSRSSRTTGDTSTNIGRQITKIQMATRQGAQHTITQKTYDIINCGPRNRFVVLGKEGPLIVHNCGAVYSDTGEVVEFDCSHRLSEMTDVIRQSSHKTLVFANFKHAIATIRRHLDKEGITCDVIHGGISAKKRTEIFADFQQKPDVQVLIIQPQAASHGVTLHAANTIVWFGPITSTETYLQANARVYRAGQKNPCTVVHLVGSDVERKLYKALENRTLAQSTLLAMYKEAIGA